MTIRVKIVLASDIRNLGIELPSEIPNEFQLVSVEEYYNKFDLNIFPYKDDRTKAKEYVLNFENYYGTIERTAILNEHDTFILCEYLWD